MLLARLMVVLSLIGLSAQAQPDIIVARVAEARERLGAALDEGVVSGRFLQQTPGAYVFSPNEHALAMAPVANPDDVGSFAIGPLLDVSGNLREDGDLQVTGYTLAAARRPLAIEVPAEARWGDLADAEIGDLIGIEITTPDGEVIGEFQGLSVDGDVVSAVVGVGGFLRLGEHNVELPLEELAWDGERLVIADMTRENLEEAPEFETADVFLPRTGTLRDLNTMAAPPPAAGGAELMSGMTDAIVPESVRAAESARAIISDLEAAARPGAMNVAVRVLDRSSEIGRRTLENVDDYAAAHAAASPEEREQIAREWRELRFTIGDHFPEAADFKAIFGRVDNYSTWRYSRIFDDSAAVVAIADPSRDQAVCSGVLVAEDLVLTAGHCFEQPPENYEVWFGFVERPNLTSSAPIRRNIAREPVAPPIDQWRDVLAGRFSAKLPDYAIVRIEPVDGEPLVPEIELLPERTVLPLPQCLSGTDPQRGDPLYVVGYPQSRPATVHGNARVEFPFRILDGSDFSRLRLDVEADFVDMSDHDSVIAELEQSYVLEDDPNAFFQFRRFFDVRDAGQPRMGIVADTFRGNSGGPVFDHTGFQCVVGILNKGMPDTGERRSVNWKVHERVLPIRAILDDLEAREETSGLIEEGVLQIR